MTGVPAKRWVYIIPVAAIMYMLAYMDRINTAMILPYMGKSFNLTSSASGLASGIFFVGYMILQIPGGHLASKWSAKKVVFILMMLWGLSAMATGLVQTSWELYVARFVLGIFEGGVWPAVLVLLALWFPQRERARANALWMACLPLSAIIMTPLTGWLLTMMSWRGVFVIEGLPPIIWGLIWWFTISDKPSEAKWISPEERAFIEKTMAQEDASKVASAGFRSAFANKTVLWLIVAYFFWMSGFYGYTMWVPTVVKSFSGIASSETVGWLSAIPFLFALASMVVNSILSDRTGRRRLHVSVPLAIGAIGLVGGQLFAHTPTMKMVFLVITAIGVYAPYGPFWAIPSGILRLEVVGAAMGLINALGNLGGFLGPYIVGYVKGVTHNSFTGFLVLAAFLIISMLVCAFLRGEKTESTLEVHSSIGFSK
ncbi:MFS transporter [Alicyclobacillus pomorum]|uniref:MFS transporter n=1 Tax=Alicyclobacillus pomorum TaxID=204470 RepID=UPI000423838D|nr:MFS transporter [Alicyclobacillus pomorum]